MGAVEGAVVVTHYKEELTFETGTTGWRVVSGCGIILRGANVTSLPDQISNQLDEVDCPACREKYALEFLAEVP